MAVTLTLSITASVPVVHEHHHEFTQIGIAVQKIDAPLPTVSVFAFNSNDDIGSDFGASLATHKLVEEVAQVRAIAAHFNLQLTKLTTVEIDLKLPLLAIPIHHNRPVATAHVNLHRDLALLGGSHRGAHESVGGHWRMRGDESAGHDRAKFTRSCCWHTPKIHFRHVAVFIQHDQHAASVNDQICGKAVIRMTLKSCGESSGKP